LLLSIWKAKAFQAISIFSRSFHYIAYISTVSSVIIGFSRIYLGGFFFLPVSQPGPFSTIFSHLISLISSFPITDNSRDQTDECAVRQVASGKHMIFIQFYTSRRRLLLCCYMRLAYISITGLGRIGLFGFFFLDQAQQKQFFPFYYTIKYVLYM
jgi:hypothetical protein